MPVGAPMHALVVAPVGSSVVADPVESSATSVVLPGPLVLPPPLDPDASSASVSGSSVEPDVGEVPKDPELLPNALPSLVPEVHAGKSHSSHVHRPTFTKERLAGLGSALREWASGPRVGHPRLRPRAKTLKSQDGLSACAWSPACFDTS